MDLFSGLTDESTHLQLGTASWLLRGFALRKETAILQALEAICAAVPLRAMQTPGGQRMSVRTTSCGVLGWVSDTRGYRYETIDPLSGAPWPAMPVVFSALAAAAAAEAGFPDFQPDACLINCYEAGAKMGLHQDKDERDFTQPIVSVSLGIRRGFFCSAVLKRSDRVIPHRAQSRRCGGLGRRRQIAFSWCAAGQAGCASQTGWAPYQSDLSQGCLMKR